MQSENKPTALDNQQTIELLIEALPQKIKIHAGYARKIESIKETLYEIFLKNNIFLNEDNELENLTHTIWQTLYEALIEKKDGLQAEKSYSTRNRIGKLLKKISKIWDRHGWQHQPPDIDVSTKGPRQNTVRLDRMGTYLFSNYKKLSEAFFNEIDGERLGKLIPPLLDSSFEAYLGLGMILSGICMENPVARLCLLHWEDFPKGSSQPFKLPRKRRNGFCWFWIPGPVQLMLEAAKCRQASNPPSASIFLSSNKELLKKINKLIHQICKENNLPVPTLTELIDNIRLHLRQYLSNIEMAVLLGMVPYRPTPTFPGQDEHHHQELLKKAPIQKTVASNQNQQVEEHPTDDSLLVEYDRILGEIQPLLDHIFQYQSPDKAILEESQIQISRLMEKEDLPAQNIGYLFQWLLSLLESKYAPGTRKVYWYAVKRIINFVPDKRLHEITSEDLEDFIQNSELDPETIRTSKQQWMHFGDFLRDHNIPMPVMDPKKIQVQSQNKTVQILNQDDVITLIRNLENPGLKLAAFLAARLGLRVSEICRLKTNDFNLGKAPVLYVFKSKGGKSRRISLDHVTENEFRRLKEICAAKSPGEFLVTDENGEPMDPKRLSEAIGKKLNELFGNDSLADIPLREHSMRAFALMRNFSPSKDIRSPASMAGHSLARTTIGSYLSRIDIEYVKKLQNVPYLINPEEVYIPTKILGKMISLTERRISQLIDEHNQSHEDAKIIKWTPEELPVERRARRGHPVSFLSYSDAVTLLDEYRRNYL